MSNGQKHNNLYKSLAIFSCSALIFTLIGIGVKAEIVNTYNKATGNELTATHWNNLAGDFLFKSIPSGHTGFQNINDSIGIKRVGTANYDLYAANAIRANNITTINHEGWLMPGEIIASLFTGSITAANVSSGTFGSTTLGSGGHYTFPSDIIGEGRIYTTHDFVGGTELCIWDVALDSWDCKGGWDDIISDELWLKDATKDSIYPKTTDYKVGIGTEDPDYPLDVDGTAQFTEIQMYNENTSDPSVYPVLNMNWGRILQVDKITVGTIDPLYRIDGINYSTFASAIVGGVKEEYISRAMIDKKNSRGEYEHVIDFLKVKQGSELWVWYYTVDFTKDNIEVLITPYGTFSQTYYLIEGDKLILRSDKPVEVSYRLMGKRFDWQNWPLKADDQEEAPSFIIDTK